MRPDIDFGLPPIIDRAFEFANEIESHFGVAISVEELAALARHLADQANYEIPPTPGTAEPVIHLSRREVIERWLNGRRA